MVKLAAVMLVLCVACGGGKKEETTPDEGGEGGGGDESGDMIPPERMDEIQTMLDRKRQVATRCLVQAIDNGKIDKNARGAITYEFVITQSGQAREVKVVKSTINNATVEECVADVIRGIEFGSLPKDLEWSYGYAFEAF